MTEWFVYVSMDYYPWAEIVEAENADAAREVVDIPEHADAAVFPLAAVASCSPELLARLRAEGTP